MGRISNHAAARSAREPCRASHTASNSSAGSRVTIAGPSAATARCSPPSPWATTIDAHGVRSRLRSRPPATVANQNDAPLTVNATGGPRDGPAMWRWPVCSSDARQEMTSAPRRPSRIRAAMSCAGHPRHEQSSPPATQRARQHRSSPLHRRASYGLASPSTHRARPRSRRQRFSAQWCVRTGTLCEQRAPRDRPASGDEQLPRQVLAGTPFMPARTWEPGTPRDGCLCRPARLAPTLLALHPNGEDRW